MIMRFRPANIRLINRRSKLLRLLLALSSGKENSNHQNKPTDLTRLTRSLHIRPKHLSTGLDHSSCSPEAKLFNIEFSDLHVSKEDPVELGCHQLKSQFFEAEYFANKDSGLVPADIAAIVHPSEKNTLGVLVLRQLARHSNGAGNVNTRWNLVV